MVTRGEGCREGIVREFGMDMYTVLCLKCITNKVPHIAHGTLFNVTRQPGWEGFWGRMEYMYS